MNDQALLVENISKHYRLGVINTGTLSRDIQSFIAKKLQVEDPNSSLISENNLNVLSDKHNRIWALKNINIEINKGQKVGIIGKNGSGKSTLLKIISRITAPSRGRVYVNGRIASLLEVGTGFHPELTGKENIYLNGSILGMTRIEIDKHLNKIIDFSGIDKFIDTPIKRYSSGMRVRLGFAVAVHLEMETLLIDEVLAVGDYNFQKRSIAKMNKSADEGKTILFVSHNMDAVRKLCDRVIVLDKGNIIYDGDTEEGIMEYLDVNNKELSAKIILSNTNNSFGNATKISFFNSRNEEKAEMKLFEDWSVLLEFHIKQKLDSVVAAVGIFTSSGIGLVTYWSKPKNLVPGKYTVKFDCDLRLKVTDLTFAIGLTSNDLSFYYEDGIGLVRIIEESMHDNPYVSKGSGLLLSSQKETIQSII